MTMRFARLMIDIKLRRGDPSALRRLDAKPRAGLQRIERLRQRARIRPGVNQRADSHIAADTRKGIEVADVHAMSLGSSSPHGPAWNASISLVITVSVILISTTRAPARRAILTSDAAG